MPLLSIVYVSSATVELPLAALDAILRASRIENARCGITGLLLYSGGNFMQAIEGPAEATESLYGKIRRDCRHKGIITLLHEKVERRQFGNWSMGFKAIDGLCVPVLSNGSAATTIQQVAQNLADSMPAACQLLTSFSQNMR